MAGNQFCKMHPLSYKYTASNQITPHQSALRGGYDPSVTQAILIDGHTLDLALRLFSLKKKSVLGSCYFVNMSNLETFHRKTELGGQKHKRKTTGNLTKFCPSMTSPGKGPPGFFLQIIAHSCSIPWKFLLDQTGAD